MLDPARVRRPGVADDPLGFRRADTVHFNFGDVPLVPAENLHMTKLYD
jgi:hypothetical protein